MLKKLLSLLASIVVFIVTFWLFLIILEILDLVVDYKIPETISSIWAIVGIASAFTVAFHIFIKFAFESAQNKTNGCKKIPLPNNYNNYFLKHWYGEHTLQRSFWVSGVLLYVIFWISVSSLTKLLSIDAYPRFTAYVLIILWIVSIIFTLWQAIGIWRSSQNYSKYSKQSWGKVAQTLVGLGMIGYFHIIYSSALPQVQEFWRIGSGQDSMNQFQIRVLRDATELEFSGHIGFGATEKVNEFLSVHPAIKIIHLNSEGGRIGPARNLAKLIESKKLSTYTSHGCYSACIIPYAAGVERLIEKDANLGFHQYRFPGLDQDDFQLEYAKDRKYLLIKNISPEFVARIFNTPSNEMWKPSHKELFQSNFITKYPEYDDVAISTIGLSDLDKFDEILLAHRVFQTIKTSDPESYNKILKAIQNAVERGHSLADVREVTIPIVGTIVTNKLPKTSREAILEYAHIVIEELTFLKSIDPYLCYGFSIGNFDATVSFPDELIERELEISANVISEYSEFVKIPDEEDVIGDLQKIFLVLENNYGSNINLLSRNTHLPAEKPIYCSLIIDYYKIILTLESSRAVSVLRYILSP